MPGRARLAESERVVEEANEIGRSVGLVERAGPGDIAGVGRAQIRQEVPAGERLRAVSGDEHIRLDDPAPVDAGPHRALAAAEVREHRTP